MKQIKGQITITEYLRELNKVCEHSGHKCNKSELWKVSDMLDDESGNPRGCPKVCCRACKVQSCGARCNGSEEPKIYPVNIKGICDDAYCPKCGYQFWYPQENDLPQCPECGCHVDWERWHRINDKE